MRGPWTEPSAANRGDCGWELRRGQEDRGCGARNHLRREAAGTGVRSWRQAVPQGQRQEGPHWAGVRVDTRTQRGQDECLGRRWSGGTEGRACEIK